MSTTNSRTTTHDRPVPDVDEPAPEYEKLYKTTGNRRQRRRRRFPPDQCVPDSARKIPCADDDCTAVRIVCEQLFAHTYICIILLTRSACTYYMYTIMYTHVCIFYNIFLFH